LCRALGEYGSHNKSPFLVTITIPAKP
jgi:hypothetical protein